MNIPTDLAATVRDLRRAGRTHGVLLRRTFPASVEQLWHACTSPDPLARWLGRLERDASGGPARLVIGESVVTVTALRCSPPYTMELLWGLPGEPDGAVRASIRAVGGGAELTVEHFALADPDRRPVWEEYLADLGEHLGGRAVRWAIAEPWTDTRWGEFDDGAFRLRRDFDAPVDALWAAVATPAGLSGWFGRVTVDDFRWEVKFDDGSAYGEIRACESGRSFAVTFVQRIDGDAAHSIEVTVSAVEGGSRLDLVHRYAAGSSAVLREGLAAGWCAYVSALARSLRTGAGDGVDGVEPDEWTADFRVARLVLRGAAPVPGADRAAVRGGAARG